MTRALVIALLALALAGCATSAPAPGGSTETIQLPVHPVPPSTP